MQSNDTALSLSSTIERTQGEEMRKGARCSCLRPGNQVCELEAENVKLREALEIVEGCNAVGCDCNEVASKALSHNDSEVKK